MKIDRLNNRVNNKTFRGHAYFVTFGYIHGDYGRHLLPIITSLTT